MDETTFQKMLGELVDEIQSLPEKDRTKLASLAQEAQKRHAKLKKTVHNLHESLDFLRLSIKYMLFDLEATRRENEYLRKMLKDRKDT